MPNVYRPHRISSTLYFHISIGILWIFTFFITFFAGFSFPSTTCDVSSFVLMVNNINIFREEKKFSKTGNIEDWSHLSWFDWHLSNAIALDAFVRPPFPQTDTHHWSVCTVQSRLLVLFTPNAWQEQNRFRLATMLKSFSICFHLRSLCGIIYSNAASLLYCASET